MSEATRKFKVGAVVIGSGVLFMGLVLFILGSSLNTNLVSYHILFHESVKGMVIGSKVNFQGIPVGAVADIRFEQGKTRVEIAIDPVKAPVQDVTIARMDRLMITGQVTVELEGYREDGEALAAGGMIPPRRSAFDEFAQSLPEVVADVDELLVSMKSLIDRLASTLDEDNQKSIKLVLANATKASAIFADELKPLIAESLRPALKSMEANFDKLGAVAKSKDLAVAINSVSAAMRRVDRIEAEVLDLVKDLRGVVGGSRRSWLGALSVAREALSEIKMLARNLRMAPSSLLYGRSEHEITVPAKPGGGKQ
jgi:phospholipid/cholesterol/gamma-HCH transport system substrate-binding protein